MLLHSNASIDPALHKVVELIADALATELKRQKAGVFTFVLGIEGQDYTFVFGLRQQIEFPNPTSVPWCKAN